MSQPRKRGQGRWPGRAKQHRADRRRRRRIARGLRALWRDNEGQAMAEYAIVVCLLLGGLTVMTFELLPEFIRGLQRYYDNFYILINLPIP